MKSVYFVDNGIEHVTNNCIKFKNEREEIIKQLNNIDNNTKNKTLLEIIEYYYYSKRLSESKDEKKNVNNGIRLIKEFIKNIGNEFNYDINKDFRRRLNKRIYSRYIDGDFLLLRYMCHRGAFKNDINEKCYFVILKIMK